MDYIPILAFVRKILYHLCVLDIIYSAIRNGHSEVAAVLLESVRDKERILKLKVEGWNCLHLATSNGDIRTMKLLFSACPEAVGQLTDEGQSCLHLAVKFNKFQAFKLVTEWFEQRGLEDLANNQDINGDTPLHLATLLGNRRILLTLLNSNMPIAKAPGINIINANGSTALDLFYTLSNGVDTDIEKQLLAAGALRAEQLLLISSPIRLLLVRIIRQLEKTLSTVFIKNALIHCSMETRTLLLTFLLAFLALPLQFVINPPELWRQSTTGPKAIKYYEVQELLLCTSHESWILFSATILTNIFILPVIFIPLLVWPLPLRNPLLAALMSVAVFYCLAVPHVLPNFIVLCGPYHVPSYRFMWVMVALTCFATYILIWLIQFTGKKLNKWTRDFYKVAAKDIKDLDQVRVMSS